MFKLADVLAATGGQRIAGRRDADFRAISIDSRTTQPGDLFVAFRGENQDGHHFVAQALQRGASGALVERTLSDQGWDSGDASPPIILCANSGQALEALARSWKRSHDVHVVGVTGSVGKTSTKEIISGVLAGRWPVLRSSANYNTEIGLPMTLMQLEDQRVAVLEMGMHDIGDIRHLASIAEPEIGVVTNVHPTHLERLGTIERIRQAKSELVGALPEGGLAVLNADDANVRSMAGLCRGHVVTYGFSDGADVRAVDIESRGLDGTSFTVQLGRENAPTSLPMPGTHFIYAALASVAVAMKLGMHLDEAAGALAHVDAAVAGRLLPVAGRHGVTLLDDAYNASPASMVAALDVLASLPGRRVAVLGDMYELGDFESEGHRIVGERAATAADWLVAIGPRAGLIADAAQTAGLDFTLIDRSEEVAAALALLDTRLRPGDTVLIKASHGMRLDRLVDGLRSRPPDGTTLDVAH